MKKPRPLIFIILLLFGLGNFASDKSYSQILEQTISEDIAEFKISTPGPRWIIAPRSVSPGPVRATLRFESPVNQFIPNVTVRVLALEDPKIPLEQWIERDLKELPSFIEIEEKRDIRHYGNPGYEIILYDPGSEILFQQWVFLAKGKSFVITCAVKKVSFERFAEDFKKILNSFEII